MSRVIHKFNIGENNKIVVREGYKVLSVMIQRGQICMWVEFDPEEAHEIVEISIYGTGVDMPDEPGKFIGSVMSADNSLVFHIYLDNK